MNNYKKIVINVCYGGFRLSNLCLDKLAKLKNCKEVSEWEIARDDPDLVKLVEEYKQESWGTYAELKIVEIPIDVSWHIAEYDGKEWVAEDHRTWK